MTTEHDPGRASSCRGFARTTHENPERMLLRALDEVDAMPQRRSCGRRGGPPDMNTFAKPLVAAVLWWPSRGGHQPASRQPDWGGRPPASRLPVRVFRVPVPFAESDPGSDRVARGSLDQAVLRRR